MRKNTILRIAILMLCVSMMIAIFCINVSAASAMTVTLDSVTANPGDTVDVAIKITSNPGGLSTLIMSVSYDTSAFELVSSANGSILSSMTDGKNLVFNDGNGSSKTGTLVTLTFKVKSPAAFGTYNITATVYECYDINENDVTANVTNGKITLECAHKNTKSIAAVSATCVDKGYTAGVYCNDCATYISGHKEVAATGKHTYGTPTVTTPPTCTEKGSQTKKCTVCSKSVTEEVAAKGHTAVVDNAVAATCTKTGLTEGSHCSVCNAVIKAQTTVAALGHKKVTNAAVAPTCTKTGLTEGSSCSRCGEIYTAQTTVAALGHTEVTDPAKDPTCTETGLTEGSHCSVCNAVIKAQTTVPANGHDNGDWTVTKEPTCTEKGTKTKFCSDCDSQVIEEIPATGHTYGASTVTKEPTCTETGEESKTCSVCDKTVKETLAALGHKYGEWIVTKEPTETETGEKSQTCERCGHAVTEEIPVISVEPDDTVEEPDDTVEEPDDTVEEPDDTVGSGETTDDGNGEETTVGTGEGTDGTDGEDGGKFCWICWFIILLLILLILATVYYVRKKMKENKEEK